MDSSTESILETGELHHSIGAVFIVQHPSVLGCSQKDPDHLSRIG